MSIKRITLLKQIKGFKGLVIHRTNNNKIIQSFMFISLKLNKFVSQDVIVFIKD